MDTGKRRRGREEPQTKLKKKRVAVQDESEDVDVHEMIFGLEQKILESRTNYNSIQTLLELLRAADVPVEQNITAAVALYRVFCRLMAAGDLQKPKDPASKEAVIVSWLRSRLKDYEAELIQLTGNPDLGTQSTALTLSMRLTKEEAAHLNSTNEAVWRDGIFAQLVQGLVQESVADDTKAEFVAKYVEEYDDVRYYTFARLADVIPVQAPASTVQNVLSILAAIVDVPEGEEELETFFVTSPSNPKHDLFSMAAHKKQAQKAWMTVLRQDLTKAQRKKVLDLMSHCIAPWFLKVELLMDFLTDSFNVGGSTSLMAFSGLFYLMQKRNLDYPQFYKRLYLLIDQSFLHSKHRSRIFRLLDTFLSSTHLPAALVASFIKRLSRLALFAPPSGIVIVIPFIYNLLTAHPQCTFMIQRNADIEQEEAEEGWGDPFQMEEPDPMKTNALESSLWEIHTLQSHYHPNVATVAKIISEQFTKQAYNLEDFLDHSYATVSLARHKNIARQTYIANKV